MRRPRGLVLHVWLGLAGGLASAGGCASTDVPLAVDLSTDLLPGVELSALELTLSDAQGVLAVRREPVFLVTPIEAPSRHRVAEFAGLSSGSYTLEVLARDISGEGVVSRVVEFELDVAKVLWVRLSRACIGVECPSAEAPGATSCLGGRCVEPGCSSLAPERCGVGCEADEACFDSVTCLAGVCVEGVCLFPPSAPACASDERCLEGMCQTACAGGCDDGDACTRDACVDGACQSEPLDGVACDDGSFCNGADTCVAGACTTEGQPPCDASLCDETGSACETGCVLDTDCPDRVVGAWTGCDFDDAVCGETGTRTQQVTVFRCLDNSCVGETTAREGECDRTTEGDACGARSCGDYGACQFAPCATDGQRNRSCSLQICRSGSCDSVFDGFETEPCTQPSQDGVSCRPPGSFCQGVCSAGSCGELCTSCGGFCTVVGCAGGTC